MTAAKQGDVAGLERILDSGVGINSVDESGYSALMWCARRGRLEAAKFLVNRGADVSLQSKSGYDAHRLALNFGHHDVASFLGLQPGATGQSRNRSGKNRNPIYANRRLKPCSREIDMPELIGITLFGKRWHSFSKVDDHTLDAVFSPRGYDYPVQIIYDKVNNSITVKYKGPTYGKRKWLAKVAKRLGQAYHDACQEPAAGKE
ncbi:MAG: ankyrin repeat domain-containing protein [Gammaproteobacteria bacterium]|nr:ankyrin repeat domain-containing protein [Gammaproteobacteria bacterium]